VLAEIDPQLPDIFMGDPTRTRQILNNLLSNAIKFTDSGSVRVRVSYGPGNVRFDIIDTGIGMSKEGLHRIFSPFSQADADTTRLYGGTGLGLTLCRQLVERMHGQILVDSEINQGTHFTVVLPLPVAEQTEEDVAQAQALSTDHSRTQNTQCLRILLVEDNHVNQLVASSMLKKLGHEVVVADQGQQALDILAADDRFDIVLMDCQMPVLDGYETTQAIRQNPKWKSLPIVAVTANVMQGDRDDCLASGMDDYITKPYNRDDLTTIIERWGPATG
jgi:CheY-like chemotaxis protein